MCLNPGLFWIKTPMLANSNDCRPKPKKRVNFKKTFEESKITKVKTRSLEETLLSDAHCSLLNRIASQCEVRSTNLPFVDLQELSSVEQFYLQFAQLVNDMDVSSYGCAYLLFTHAEQSTATAIVSGLPCWQKEVGNF